MRRGGEAVVGPARHQVAGVDPEAACDRRHVDPGVLDLQSADNALCQDCEGGALAGIADRPRDVPPAAGSARQERGEFDHRHVRRGRRHRGTRNNVMRQS
jgi:hypothetical protein